MSDEIVMGSDRPELIQNCIRLAASNPQKNVLLLADLYSPHLELSDIYIMLQKGKAVDFSTVYRGFPNPSLVLGISASTKLRLLDYVLPRMKGGFTCICEPKELNLFEDKATIVDEHYEYQMILEGQAKREEAMAEIKAELVLQAELGKLDRFLRENGASAWLPVQFQSGPYYCVKLEDEIVSVAGVHFVTPEIAQLGNIVTAKSHRKRGYATHSTYTLVSALHSDGKLISLFVAEDNGQAVEVYERIGFHKKRKLVYANLRPL